MLYCDCEVRRWARPPLQRRPGLGEFIVYDVKFGFGMYNVYYQIQSRSASFMRTPSRFAAHGRGGVGEPPGVWYGTVRYGMVWYGMVWYDMVWYGMVWYGTVRYGMVRYGMVWHHKL